MSVETRVARSERRVLMIAFHFPPMAGSSGLQRSLRFAQQLPAFGWHPLVLTAHPRAYDSTADDLLQEIPDSMVVKRVSAFDSSRHFSLFGRYPGFLVRPDRWRSWIWSAVPAGLHLIRQFHPQVIWSTYPIASAHQIAAHLHQRSSIPWVADFRDPMAQDGYPSDRKVWRSFERIERTVAAKASRMIFVTPSALDLYRRRYHEVPESHFELIENGYDEGSFAEAESSMLSQSPLNPECVTLLHSGIVYPSERDPTALFRALGQLRASGALVPDSFKLRFRAPVHPDLLLGLAERSNTSDIVEVMPSIPYREALGEMLRADGLVVMQGANCNEQIPAKLYEYVRARRPILGLADEQGDTARALAAAGLDMIAKLEDAESIRRTLLAFVIAVREKRAARPSESAISSASRHSRARQLARVLDDISARSVRTN